LLTGVFGSNPIYSLQKLARVQRVFRTSGR
jgi:hypothetical protein